MPAASVAGSRPCEVRGALSFGTFDVLTFAQSVGKSTEGEVVTILPEHRRGVIDFIGTAAHVYVHPNLATLRFYRVRASGTHSDPWITYPAPAKQDFNAINALGGMRGFAARGLVASADEYIQIANCAEFLSSAAGAPDLASLTGSDGAGSGDVTFQSQGGLRDRYRLEIVHGRAARLIEIPPPPPIRLAIRKGGQLTFSYNPIRPPMPPSSSSTIRPSALVSTVPGF